MTAANVRAVLLLLTLALPAGTAAQDRVPRFETGACPFPLGAWARGVRVECGHLVVPEDRERPERRTLRLAVAILRAPQPSGAPPLVMLHGGPAGVGGLRYWFPSGAAAWPRARHRDIVIYDLRGAGLSEPRLCPDFDQSGRLRYALSRHRREEQYAANVRACVDSLRARGIEPAAYNTATNVADLIDLRRVLGYATWGIYGVSYGSRLAQEAMRRDSLAVRSVILAGPLMPGPAGQAERSLTQQRALEHIFAACGAQPPCRAAFPSLERDFYDLYDELTVKPLEVAGEGSPATPTWLDGELLVRGISGAVSATREVARVPLLIHELRRGDRARAARVLIRTAAATGVRALGGLVYCYDVYGDAFREAVATVRSQLRPAFRALADDQTECSLWQQRFADPTEHAPVSSDIPTLILTGEFDPQTPTEFGQRIAASLKRAYLYEIPGESHAARPTGCHESILLQFLDNPTREPDASCIATMPRISFATKELSVPTFVLVITAVDSARTEFAGRWEAEFPNAARVFTLELKADGRTLTGTFDPTREGIPITHGSIDDRTIRFRIRSPDGDRIITFTGRLNGDQISFTRDVEVRDGGAPGGAGIFGAAGARTSTAQRVW